MEEGMALASELQINYIQVSAKDGDGVQEMFTRIAQNADDKNN